MSAEHDREPNSMHPDDRRDAALERAWRESSRDEPSSGIDARILAAARASVGAEEAPRAAPPARTRRNVLQRWQPLLAAAAVAGLAFVLVPMTMSPPATERASAPTATRAVESSETAPAYEAALPESPPTGADVDARTMDEPLPTEVPVVREAVAPERAPPAPPTRSDARAPQASPAVPAPPPATTATSARPAAAAASVDPNARRAVESAAAPTSQAREKHAEGSTPSDTRSWVERIETAYRRGDRSVAAEALRAFREVEPDADRHLPDDLRDWARTVDNSVPGTD